MALRGNLEKRLEKIEHRLIKMTSLVQRNLELTIQAIAKNDDALAVQVIELDKGIDELEMDIEKKCVSTIGLQQPIAGDLRTITSVLKIITDLERIGDYAADIAKIQIMLKTSLSDYVSYLEPMYETIQEMLTMTLAAFIEKDPEKARTAGLLDEKVDAYYRDTGNVLVMKLREMDDGDEKDRILQLLFIIRYAERMGDHITNMCERVIYMLNGIHEFF
ncbi:phosphate signaling complex protein PhoU [Guggenheimella bovis]